MRTAWPWSGRGFSLGLVGHIVEQMRGYPYFLQFFAAFACSRIGLARIERSDFERVKAALLHGLDLAFFEDRFLTASPAEQQILGAMAAVGSRRVGPSATRSPSRCSPPTCVAMRNSHNSRRP